MSGPPTREEEVDQLLAAWDQRLGRVDENLIALEADPTYQMLSGGARATLVGRTRDRVLPALDELGELFEHRERLAEVVGRAKELRAELSFFGKEDKLKEIAALLGGPSIKLGTKQMPVRERNLLDAATRDVSVVPEDLLGQMVRAYQLARDAVSEVSAAWERTEPRLLDLEREVAAVTELARELGQADATKDAVARVAAELARARTRVATDPLGVDGSLDRDVAPLVRDVKAMLDEMATQKAAFARGMAEAASLIAKLDVAVHEAAVAVARGEREIAGFTVDGAGRAARLETSQGLEGWREKIAAAATARHWRAASVGIARWLEVARGVLDAELAVAAAARAAEGERTELAGRLSARRAQAAALASRGVVLPSELEQLARAAEATLRGRPTDLATAKKQVDRFEAEVRALSR